MHASGATLARLKKGELGPDPALFSIVMPTYKTDPDILRMAIDSVVAQTDRHWELVISDSSSSPALRDYMRARADEDPRIRVILNKGRLGISDNTNVALRAAKGEYVGFMDHDDELAPEAISLNRAAFATGLYDIVYSDEDKIDLKRNSTVAPTTGRRIGTCCFSLCGVSTPGASATSRACSTTGV